MLKSQVQRLGFGKFRACVVNEVSQANVDHLYYRKSPEEILTNTKEFTVQVDPVLYDSYGAANEAARAAFGFVCESHSEAVMNTQEYVRMQRILHRAISKHPSYIRRNRRANMFGIDKVMRLWRKGK